MHENTPAKPLTRMHVPYRSDIDGLRALAVLPVVLFHLGVPAVSGGYVGVDVFFVISGYLITGVISRELSGGSFSIIRFYERRCRRILPALFTTMLAVLIASLFVFMPDELRDFGTSLVGVAAFASNILYWQQVDYFNGAVELKPLIHTWSLAVEEQFYIFLPLLMLLVNKHAGGGYKAPLLLLTLLSFALSIAMMHVAADADYYLLPTRAWELLIGSVVALGYLPAISNKSAASLCAASGLLAITASAIFLTHDSPFPGYNALWPCIGAAAYIHANGTVMTPAGRLMSARPIVAVGLISYSLYLIHWPVIVFVDYVLLRSPTALETGLMLIAMIVLAAVSWRFVERPFRRSTGFSQRQIFLGSLIGLIFFAVIGAGLFTLNGLPQRFPGLKAATVKNDQDEPAGPKCFLKDQETKWGGAACFLTHVPNGRITLLWGDSHANHYKRAVTTVQPPVRANVLYYGSAGCLPVLHNTGKPRPYCNQNNGRLLNIIRQFNVSVVVMSGYWQYISEHSHVPFSDIEATVKALRAAGVDVRIIGDNPDFDLKNPQFLAYRLEKREHPGAPFYLATRNDPSFNRRLRILVGSSKFYDPLADLCHHHKCLAYERGEIMMTDNAHFSNYGAQKVLEHARSIFE